GDPDSVRAKVHILLLAVFVCVGKIHFLAFLSAKIKYVTHLGTLNLFEFLFFYSELVETFLIEYLFIHRQVFAAMQINYVFTGFANGLKFVTKLSKSTPAGKGYIRVVS